MLREHAPLIAVSTVIAVMFYLVFRDLRGLRAAVNALHVPSGPPALPPRKLATLDAAEVDADDLAEDDDELVEAPLVKPARRK